MAGISVREYQEQLATKLRRLIGVETATEWRTMAGEPGVYSPRLDVAVGPFATGELQYGAKFDELIAQHDGFLRRLFQVHEENLQSILGDTERFEFNHAVTMNWNARCFLGIEIENKNSRKHLMGGAINAASLGRIGVAVGWNMDAVRAFLKLRSYLLFLMRVGKNTFKPLNLLVVDSDQLMDIVSVGKTRRRQVR